MEFCCRIWQSKLLHQRSCYKLISCSCKTGFGNSCGCRRLGIKCTTACTICAGQACSNIAQQHAEQEEAEDKHLNGSCIPVHFDIFLFHSCWMTLSLEPLPFPMCTHTDPIWSKNVLVIFSNCILHLRNHSVLIKITSFCDENSQNYASSLLK